MPDNTPQTLQPATQTTTVLFFVNIGSLLKKVILQNLSRQFANNILKLTWIDNEETK